MFAEHDLRGIAIVCTGIALAIIIVWIGIAGWTYGI